MQVYLEFHLSGKKRHSLEEIANEMKERLLKIGGTHGIRWAASQARLILLILNLSPTLLDPHSLPTLLDPHSLPTLLDPHSLPALLDPQPLPTL